MLLGVAFILTSQHFCIALLLSHLYQITHVKTRDCGFLRYFWFTVIWHLKGSSLNCRNGSQPLLTCNLFHGWHHRSVISFWPFKYPSPLQQSTLKSHSYMPGHLQIEAQILLWYLVSARQEWIAQEVTYKTLHTQKCLMSEGGHLVQKWTKDQSSTKNNYNKINFDFLTYLYALCLVLPKSKDLYVIYII